MEKWKIADFVHLKCEERNHYNNSPLCQSWWLLFTSCGDKSGQSKWRVKTCCTARNILLCNLKAVTSAKIIFYEMNITACSPLGVYFPVICLRPFYGKSVVYSMDPIAMEGPITELNEIFFWTVINEICEIWLSNREQSQIFEVIFVVVILAIECFIFFNNT